MTLQVQMPLPADRDVIRSALEGLVRANVSIMRRLAHEGVIIPSIFQAGVVFRKEAPGEEDWQTVDRLIKSKEGDCEDIAGAYAAELRMRGEEDACVDVVPIDDQGNFHAVVRRSSGALEDPSKIIIEQEANMANMIKPRVRIRGVQHHTVGSIDLPMAGGRCLQAHAVGFDPADALMRVVDAVVEASSNPAVYALLPPQASAALLAIHGINQMTDGALRKLSRDDRSLDSQKKLAEIVLKARKEKKETPTASLWDTWVKGSTPSTAGVVGVSSVTVRDHRGGIVNPVSKSPGARDARAAPSGLPPPAAPPGTYDRPAATPAQNLPDPSAPMPGQMDPTGQYVFVGPTASTPGHWERPSGYNAPQQPYPGAPPPPGYPPYPQGPPGYPPYGGYPPPMPQYPPPYGGYPPPMPQYPDPYGGYSPYGSPYGYQQDPMAQYYQMVQAGIYPPQQMVPWDPSQIQAQPLTPDEAAALQLWGGQSFAEGSFPGYM